MACPRCGSENPEWKNYCGDCGAALISVNYSRRNRIHTDDRGPYQIRINMLCLIGAVIAVLSLSMPWILIQADGSNDPTYIGAFELDDPIPGIRSLPETLQYSLTIFIIGTVIAFFTPLGGIPQLMGSVGVLLTTITTKLEDGQMGVYLGAGAAVVGSVCVLLSLLTPLGIGYSVGHRWGVSGRLMTWSAFRSIEGFAPVVVPSEVESEDLQDMDDPSAND